MRDDKRESVGKGKYVQKVGEKSDWLRSWKHQEKCLEMKRADKKRQTQTNCLHQKSKGRQKTIK